MARRIALLTVLALAVAAAPAQAQEQLCRRQLAPPPVPTQAEKERADLQSWADQRAEFGFRHDIPYVRELVRRGVWEYDVGFIPVTPARERLPEAARRARARAQARSVPAPRCATTTAASRSWTTGRASRTCGGTFTKDVAKHLAALKRLARYPDNLRAKGVAKRA